MRQNIIVAPCSEPGAMSTPSGMLVVVVVYHGPVMAVAGVGLVGGGPGDSVVADTYLEAYGDPEESFGHLEVASGAIGWVDLYRALSEDGLAVPRSVALRDVASIADFLSLGPTGGHAASVRPDPAAVHVVVVGGSSEGGLRDVLGGLAELKRTENIFADERGDTNGDGASREIAGRG